MRKILWVLSAVVLMSLCVPAAADGPLDCADKTARTSAAWARSAVVYEVFTRAFSREGTFAEVEKALPRLKDLGVTVVWLMPVHKVGMLNRKGHLGCPYSVRDYYSIDPAYGGPDDLKSLVKRAHGLGMKVIIDMVANHTAWDSVMMGMDKNFYTRVDGKVVPPVPDWTDTADLDYGYPGLRRYMTDMLVHWVREFDLDGFRCDVADMIPLDFWEKAREELEKIKPELLMLAEGDRPQDHLKAFDLTYSWKFYEALIDTVVRGKPASSLAEAWAKEIAPFPKGALLMRFNDNHDKVRAVNLFGDEGALLTAAVALTVPGIPMLYNGQEIGDPVPSNDPALFEKYDILWDNHPPRIKRFDRLYRSLLALRSGSRALREGDLAFLPTDRPDAVFAYARTAGPETVVAVANTTNRPVTVTVGQPGKPLPEGLKRLFPADGGAAPAPGAALDLKPYEFLLFGR